MTILTSLLRAAALLAWTATGSWQAMAQTDGSSQPIQLVAVQGPGTSTDLVTRAVADKLGQRLGRQVIVVNKPGGGGRIATDFVAKSPPNGLTLLLGNPSVAAFPGLFKDLPFDTLRDLTGVGMVGESPMVVVVNTRIGVNDINQLIAYGKKHTGAINYASGGIGSATHLTCALLAAKAGVDMTHVPYTQTASILPDLISNRVQLMCVPPPSAMQLVREGESKVLGSTGLADMTAPFSAPSIAKAARIDFNATNWYALFAPAKTPKPVLQKLQHALTEALADPEVRGRLNALGLSANPLVGDKFDAFFRGEVDTWRKVVSSSGATKE